MCGIVGYCAKPGNKLPQVGVLEVFNDTLAHRGPDGRGSRVFQQDAVFLGHRRLGILDTGPGGSQPMTTSDGRYTLVFNGEIYNFLEVRTELVGLGFSFKSECDAEVLLQAFNCWGADCVHKLNGMWAFAIWDHITKQLLLCRDRFGVKPIHYVLSEKYFAFASELKAFLVLPEFEFSFNAGVVARCLCNGNFVEGTEETIVLGIKRLQPGYWLELDLKNWKSQLTRWWHTIDHLRFNRNDFNASPQDVTEEFLDLLEDACNLRLRSDVALGTALSGGLDSSSVLATLQALGQPGSLVKRRAPEWQKAHVLSYQGTSQDETVDAKYMAAHLGLEASVETFSISDFIGHLDAYIYHFEEIYPFRGSISHLYQNMKNTGLSISIDGHGCDEILAGYHHHPAIAMLDAAKNSRGLAPIAGLRNLRKSMYVDDTKSGMGKYGQYLDAYYPAEYFRFSHGYLRQEVKDASFPDWEDDQHKMCDFSHLNRSLYFDFHCTLLPTILRNFDRLSMAHGLEIRAPFMDYRVVTFALSLPNELKLSNGYTKWILRNAMKDRVPDQIRLRKSKIGFADPMENWLEDGLAVVMLDIAHSREFIESEMWRGLLIRDKLVSARSERKWSRMVPMWPFVQAQLLKTAFNRVSSST